MGAEAQLLLSSRTGNRREDSSGLLGLPNCFPAQRRMSCYRRRTSLGSPIDPSPRPPKLTVAVRFAEKASQTVPKVPKSCPKSGPIRQTCKRIYQAAIRCIRRIRQTFSAPKYDFRGPSKKIFFRKMSRHRRGYDDRPTSPKNQGRSIRPIRRYPVNSLGWMSLRSGPEVNSLLLFI